MPFPPTQPFGPSDQEWDELIGGLSSNLVDTMEKGFTHIILGTQKLYRFWITMFWITNQRLPNDIEHQEKVRELHNQVVSFSDSVQFPGTPTEAMFAEDLFLEGSLNAILVHCSQIRTSLERSMGAPDN